jgi:hypothetical protein
MQDSSLQTGFGWSLTSPTVADPVSYLEQEVSKISEVLSIIPPGQNRVLQSSYTVRPRSASLSSFE